MVTRATRKIVRIDEEKCNGCGACVPACAEGALQIIDGKARLVSDKYCDGLGACLGECPQGAITVEEREAEYFDEEAAKLHLDEKKQEPCACPAVTISEFEKGKTSGAEVKPQSMLSHFPIQLALVPANAPFLKGAEVLLVADCVPFTYAGFHQDFLKDRALLVACPKLDDFPAHLKKLTEIVRQSEPKSLTVVHMEVPCCSGLVHMAKQAVKLSEKDIPVDEIIIGIKGDRK